MNELTVKKDTATLAVEIRTLQQQAQAVVLSYAIEIGRRLLEAKELVPHGQWGEWLETEVNFSQSTAQNYMKIFERYGSAQISLFGDAKSQSIGNLPYTKALKLLAVPEEEMDAFVEENDVENMSVRELEQAIRERDEARKALEEEKTAGKELRDAAEEAQANAETAEAEADAAKQEARQLRQELEELKTRPVDVAVQAPTEEMMSEIREQEARKFQEERETLEKKLAAAEEMAKKQAEKAKSLKDAADQAAQQARDEMQHTVDASEVAKKEAEAKATELEKRLKLADSDTAIFQVYFSSVQEDCNRMIGIIKKANRESADKLRSAMKSLLGVYEKAVAETEGEK